MSEALGAKGCATLDTQQLTGCFGSDGARFSAAQGAALSLNLTAWGRGAKLVPVAAVVPAVEGERVSYTHGDLTEWWRVLPMGFEQGFTVVKRPAGHGPLVIALAASTAPAAVQSAAGHTAKTGTISFGELRYGQLVVTDARGQVIPATLKTRGKQILIAVNDAQAVYPLTVDPLVWIEQKVTASDAAPDDYFGVSVAISGSTAIIGADEATVNGHVGQGAAYVFTESAGTWTEAQKLTASDGAAGDGFGISVALDGSTAAIGALGANIGGNSGQGAAYVFTESGGTWTQMDKLTASDGTAFAEFGDTVALDGTTAMVGKSAPTGGGNDQGAVYVFNEIQVCGGNYTWQQGQKLQASDGVSDDDFGASIALAGATAVIGAPGAAVNGNAAQGAAYVFTQSGGTWSQVQKLVAQDGSAIDGFGGGVALSGTTALVGAWAANIAGNPDQGAAYVFSESGGTWTQTAELTASDGGSNDSFGGAVALSGTTALISAGAATVDGKIMEGAVYVFDGSGSGWTQAAKITPSDGHASSSFGNAVAISGSNLLVGARMAIPAPNEDSHGAAYFESPGNLALTLNAPASVAPDAQYQGEMILTNNAATATPAVAAAIPVPSGSSFVSATPAQGTCTPGATSIACALGSLAGNGGTAKVAVTFKATGAAGSSIAHTANVTNASPAVTASANTAIVGTPTVSLAPAAVSFSAQAVGTASAAKTVTLSNTGNADLAGIAVSITGTDAGDFSETNKCPATLSSAAGSNSCTVSVTFKPTAGGARSASLSIASNAAGSPVSVALTGTGDVPPVAKGQSFSIPDNASLDGTLTATGSGTLTYSIPGKPAHGSATLTASSGALVYTPDPGFTGTDSFEFTASDGTATSQPATVTITVTAASGPSPIGPPVTPKHGSSGGGAFGIFGLLLLAPLVGFRKRHA